MGFHEEGVGGKQHTVAGNRAAKEQRVREGRAHAALVYDDDGHCVGWCQFGEPDELPRIKNKKVYVAGLEHLPDWRITCFFTGKGHRRRGVADAALEGALREIARLGGGAVEGYPDDTSSATTSAAFLHGGTLALFERHGFERDRAIGKTRWVVRRTVKKRRP